MSQILCESATVAASALRRKEISSRELTEMLLARIDAVNPAVNAVVELRAEAAMAEADSADKAIMQGPVGPLHGLPMTVKDSFNVVGVHTTWGNPDFRNVGAQIIGPIYEDDTAITFAEVLGDVVAGYEPPPL